MVMARTKTEERQLASESKSPKKRSSVRYPFKFLEKRHNRKSVEGRFQSKIQTAVSGTENTVKTHGKNNTPKIYFGSIISEREKTSKRIGTGSLSRDNAQEPTLPART